MSLNIIFNKIEKQKQILQRIFLKFLEETLKKSCAFALTFNKHMHRGRTNCVEDPTGDDGCGWWWWGIDSIVFTRKSLGFVHVFLRWMVSLVRIVVAAKYRRNLDNLMSIYLSAVRMALKGFCLSRHRPRH